MERMLTVTPAIHPALIHRATVQIFLPEAERVQGCQAMQLALQNADKMQSKPTSDLPSTPSENAGRCFLMQQATLCEVRCKAAENLVLAYTSRLVIHSLCGNILLNSKVQITAF